jgi:hypothetical protein
MPIQVLSAIVENLSPQLEKFCIKNEAIDETMVLEYLAKKTMVGILPQPHPIIIHRFDNSVQTRKWITSYMWGSFYMQSLDVGTGQDALVRPSMWVGTKVKLFGVSFQ